MPEHGKRGLSVLIENRYAALAAVAAFMLVTWATGSLYAAFGGFALIAGIAWAVRKMFGK